MGAFEAAVPWSLTLGLSVAAVVIGKFAHEATHAAVAFVLGSRDIHVDWMDCSVYYRLSASHWAHRAVALAPVAVGLTFGYWQWYAITDGFSGVLAAVLSIVELVGVAAPPGTYQYDMLNMAIFAGWFWYTFRGGIEDFRWSAAVAGGRAYDPDDMSR